MEFNDLTGQRFGMLKVIGYAGMDSHHNKKWLCECDCGNQKVIRQGSLLAETTQSCGCLRHKQREGKKNITIAGETKSAFAWSKITGISYNRVLYAFDHGGESAARELIEKKMQESL